jgi:hypothetical protein
MTILRVLFFVFLLSDIVSGGERFPIPYFPERDLTHQETVIKAGEIDLHVNISPRPIMPLSNEYLCVRFTKKGEPINPEKVTIKFNMKMDMGNFVYMANVKNGVLVQKFVVPKCIFLDKRWYVKIEFVYKGTCYQEVFLYDVKN